MCSNCELIRLIAIKQGYAGIEKIIQAEKKSQSIIYKERKKIFDFPKNYWA